jgi:hypothetical protein
MPARPGSRAFYSRQPGVSIQQLPRRRLTRSGSDQINRPLGLQQALAFSEDFAALASPELAGVAADLAPSFAAGPQQAFASSQQVALPSWQHGQQSQQEQQSQQSQHFCATVAQQARLSAQHFIPFSQHPGLEWASQHALFGSQQANFWVQQSFACGAAAQIWLPRRTAMAKKDPVTILVNMQKTPIKIDTRWNCADLQRSR